MRRIKASATALIIAVILFIYVYKPVEHEQHAESPTESSQMIPPADDVAVMLPPKPVEAYVPPLAETVAVAKEVNKPATSNVKPTQKEAQTKDKPREESTISTFTLTHYTATCRGCTGVTYSGHDVRSTIYVGKYRVVAVDKNVIPLGSVIEITYDDGRTITALASDIGGGVKGKHIDLLVSSKSEAKKLGRKSVGVRIISRR